MIEELQALYFSDYALTLWVSSVPSRKSVKERIS